SSVLEVIYLVFNEGYSATTGDEWVRPALCEDALRLGRILAELVPEEPEVHGLVALLEIQASRLQARVGPGGEPVLLADQDRARTRELSSAAHRAGRFPRQARPLRGSAGRVRAGGGAHAQRPRAHAAPRPRRPRALRTMIVHLVDGTYELFRQFYGRRRATEGQDAPFGAVSGVLHSVLAMIEQGAPHVGVATDHVIEPFRNDLWPDYKTGEGVDPALVAQFYPLEQALVAVGVAVWPMTDLEADDALASAAQIASGDERVEKVCIWSPDKDLAQCVRGERVVQVDRKGQNIRNAAGVREKFGVEPMLIPDFLALVGDAADGYPGIPRIGAVTAARLLNQYGRIEDFPASVLGAARYRALLFKDLAT